MLKDSVDSRHTHSDFNTHNVHVGPSHVCVFHEDQQRKQDFRIELRLKSGLQRWTDTDPSDVTCV